MGTAIFSGNSNYYLDIDAALVSQNFGGNFSTIYWRVDVVKTYGSGFWASTGVGNRGSASSSQGGLWNAGDLAYDFRNGSMTGRWTLAQGQFNVPHRSDGTASYYVTGSLNLANLGSASAGTGWRDLPRLANVPDAPAPVGFGTIEQTSIQYIFAGRGNGGSPIREWQALYQEITASGAANGAQVPYASGGNTPIGGLKPGVNYRFWSRGRNDVGWGPWSSPINTKTHAGARIKVNGVWRDAVPMIKVNGVWRIAQPLIKVNGTWKKSI